MSKNVEGRRVSKRKGLKQADFITANYLDCCAGSGRRCLRHEVRIMHGARSQIRQNLKLLAAAAGVNTEGARDRDIYLEAARVLSARGELEANTNVRNLRRAAELHNERAAAQLERPDRKQPRNAEDGPAVHHIVVNHNGCRHVGFIPGEIVKATPTGDLKAGDIAALVSVGAKTYDIGRVVSVTPRCVTLRQLYADGGPVDVAYPRDKLTFTGRVDPEPVGRTDDPTAEQWERLTELRARLNRLADITDESERFRVEREIFDIEHPAPSADDTAEWPEVIGGDV